MTSRELPISGNREDMDDRTDEVTTGSFKKHNIK